MVSLGEKILKLTNPTPEVVDPEDNINFELAAQSYSSDENVTDIEEISDLRRRTAPLLEDLNKNYLGRKVSRNKLRHIFLEENESNLDEEKVEESDIDDESENLSEEEQSYDEEEQNQEGEVSTDEDDNTSDDMAQQFSNIDVSSEIEKGQAIKNQKEIWNRLMETRIKLQKLLIIANKLPQAATWNILKDKGGKEMTETLNKASLSVNHVMDKWFSFQSELCDKNREINSACSNENMKTTDNSNEEISSDTDIEMEKEIPNKTEKISKKRKIKVGEYDSILEKRFKSLVPYRNSVIQKWDEKTRLSTGRMTQKSFSGFDNSALKQIEQIFQDKTRLVRRTQLKRSLYRVLGCSESTELQTEHPESEASASKQDMLLKDYDPEIFDDDDFYRQILKDVIESKSIGIDPSVIRKQMEIQKIRNKMKRKVDTKASKGRKLRYDIHPKLVNFMAPVQNSQIPDEARDSFLKYVFGGRSILS